MKLYKKKLRSVSELEQEKMRLKAAMSDIEKDSLFTVEGIVEEATSDISKKLDTTGLPGMLQDTLMPALSSVLGNDSTLGSTKKKKDKKSSKRGSGLIGTVAKEFLGGYLKWKAVELSFKGIKMVISKQKKKKKEASQP